MNIFLVILFLLAVNACAFLFIYNMVWPQKKSSHRTTLLVLTIGGSILFDVLFTLTALIPSNADGFIKSGIVRMETSINNISPDYVNQEMDTAQIRSVLTDTKQIESYLKSNEGARFVVRLIGVNAYVKYMESFTSSLDSNLSEMQEEGIPITLHNVLERVQQKSHEPILKTAKILEILLLVVVLLYAAFLLFMYYSEKKGWSSEASVTLGDKYAQAPDTQTKE